MAQDYLYPSSQASELHVKPTFNSQQGTYAPSLSELGKKHKRRENTVENWNQAIEDALEYRRQYGREHLWASVEALFYQAHQMQQRELGSNIIFAIGDSLLSELTVPNPRFLLKALRQDFIDKTPMLESTLNMLLAAQNYKQNMSTAVLHAYLFGQGIIKLGYDSEFGYEPDLDLGQLANPQTVLGMSLTQFDRKGQKIEYNSTITPGMPWINNVLPHDFLVPWGTFNIKTSPWCAHRIVRHIDDIKADPKYSNKKDLQPQLSMSDYVKSYLTVMKPYRMGVTQFSGRHQSSDKAEYVELWEIHDARTSRIMVIAQGHDKFLRDDIDYLQEDGLPFVSIGFTPAARTFWNTPDAVYLESSQKEIIDIAEMAKAHRRISLLKFLYEDGSIDSDELDKLLSGEIGMAVKYKKTDSGNPPVMPFVPTTPNNQLQNEQRWTRDDARETIGFSRNAVGEFEGSGRRTATEAGIVDEKGSQRMGRRSIAVADCWSEIGKKLSNIIFKFWRTPRLVEIIGQDGAAQWSAFTGQDLKGEYLYNISFSSDPPDTTERRKQQAITLFQQLSLDPTVDPIALRRMLVRAFNDPDFSSIFKPGVVNNAGLLNAMQQPGMQPQLGNSNAVNGGVGQTQPGSRPQPVGGGPQPADGGQRPSSGQQSITQAVG